MAGLSSTFPAPSLGVGLLLGVRSWIWWLLGEPIPGDQGEDYSTALHLPDCVTPESRAGAADPRIVGLSEYRW